MRNLEVSSRSATPLELVTILPAFSSRPVLRPGRAAAAAPVPRGVRDRTLVHSAGQPLRPGHRPLRLLLVPVRFIDRQLRVLLHANDLVVHDGRTVVAHHERVSGRGESRLVLEALPGSAPAQAGRLPGLTALEQAKAAGKFTSVHEAWWTAARAVHGEAAGTVVSGSSPTAAGRVRRPGPSALRAPDRLQHHLHQAGEQALPRLFAGCCTSFSTARTVRAGYVTAPPVHPRANSVVHLP